MARLGCISASLVAKLSGYNECRHLSHSGTGIGISIGLFQNWLVSVVANKVSQQVAVYHAHSTSSRTQSRGPCIIITARSRANTPNRRL